MTVIAATFIFFIIGVFVKGITHELLIEIGVLLVSVKLIMMNKKNALANEQLLNELKEIKNNLQKK